MDTSGGGGRRKVKGVLNNLISSCLNWFFDELKRKVQGLFRFKRALEETVYKRYQLAVVPDLFAFIFLWIRERLFHKKP